MGASSSSSFWNDLSYDHSSRELNCIYDDESSDIRIMRVRQFTIGEAKSLLYKENLFPDITLVLDIDFTLGEACSIYTKGDEVFLENRKVEKSVIDRLLSNRNAFLFHKGSCLFFIRPYFEEFIKFCDKNFKEVIIWTNGVQQHANDMVELINSFIGKRWKGYGRTYSTNDAKIVINIGLDPNKTWLVDDDHRHYYIDKNRDYHVNQGIKFFHTPEFSVLWFKDFYDKIPLWGNTCQLYDDWFLFLIWNWNHMKENGIDMKEYIRNNQKFVYNTISDK
jgi:hypothetical protein